MAKPFPAGPLSIALALTPPGPTDPGIEVAAPGYSRKVVNFLPPSDLADTTLANELTTEWPRATSLWGDIGWVAAYDLDGAYVGWGNIVSHLDGVTPIVERIDRGDVARFGAGSMIIPPEFIPGGYGLKGFGVGPYGYVATGYIPPSPFGIGKYSAGPYSRGKPWAFIYAAISAAFDPASVYPGALPSACCPAAAAWTVEALP